MYVNTGGINKRVCIHIHKYALVYAYLHNCILLVLCIYVYKVGSTTFSVV